MTRPSGSEKLTALRYLRALSPAVVLLATCVLLGPPSAAFGRGHSRAVPVTVMTYNLFQGSELSHTQSATSFAAVPAAVAADYANVVSSNIPARAQAIAAEIKASAPALVGVQEAVLWRTQSPPPAVPFALPGTATSVSYDFVALLVQALGRLGAHYRAVAITNNVDVQITGAFSNAQQIAVRFTDRVAILARRGVEISNVRDENFTAHDSLDLLSVHIPVLDGYASVDARVHWRMIRFITTHFDGLKTADAPAIRAAEAKEILEGPANTSLPVVFTCDCNSTPTSLVHNELTGGGLRDRWRALNPRQAGLTCCHRSSPSDPETDVADPHPRQGLIERIDYVWAARQFTVVSERTVGLNPADRTKTTPRLWPSDHLGLIAQLTLSSGRR